MFTRRRRGGRNPFKVRQRKAAAMDKLPDHPMNAWEGEKYLGGTSISSDERLPKRRGIRRRRRR